MLGKIVPEFKNEDIGFSFSFGTVWFDEQITRQIREHFDRILHGDIEGKQPHIRGLTYVLHGRDVILISDYAKSLKRKCVNNNFVLQFNLDRAFSTNKKLLATAPILEHLPLDESLKRLENILFVQNAPQQKYESYLSSMKELAKEFVIVYHNHLDENPLVCRILSLSCSRRFLCMSFNSSERPSL
jgi:hypothetical protein